MKNLNEFIAESIANKRLDEINDNFVNWMSERYREFAGDPAALEELVMDELNDFAKKYNVTDKEIKELSDSTRKDSFSKWINYLAEVWGLV